MSPMRPERETKRNLRLSIVGERRLLPGCRLPQPDDGIVVREAASDCYSLLKFSCGTGKTRGNPGGHKGASDNRGKPGAWTRPKGQDVVQPGLWFRVYLAVPTCGGRQAPEAVAVRGEGPQIQERGEV